MWWVGSARPCCQWIAPSALIYTQMVDGTSDQLRESAKYTKVVFFFGLKWAYVVLVAK